MSTEDDPVDFDSPPPRKRAAGKAAAKPRESANQVTLLIRDVAIAGVAVLLVIGLLLAYSGTWPPMVVIESNSMQHANDQSFVGVIDTGDLTLVKKVNSDGDIITYMQGERMTPAYQTYGTFGDVIIYSKNGHGEITPIIHRAITRIVLNTSTSGALLHFDFPELDPPRYHVPANQRYDLGLVWTWHGATPSGVQVHLEADLTAIATSFAGDTSGFTVGFLTKGDHNTGIDQGSLPVFGNNRAPYVQPVKVEWIVGKAQGELPWFGAIKLWAGGAPCTSQDARSCVPGNSKSNLIIAILVIAVGPYLIEKGWERYGDRVTRRIPPKWKSKWHGAWDKLPGGEGRAERREERRRELEGIRRKTGGRRRGGGR